MIKMFGFKKKDKKKAKKGKKIKKENISNLQKVDEATINVRVFAPLGGHIRVLKAQYTAKEKRNDFGELVSVNDDYNHDQEVNFYMDSVYENMQIVFKMQNKTAQESQAILDKQIKKQEKLIFLLERVPEINAFHNYQDEYARLRNLRVMRNYLRLDESGSYFYIEKGVRTYEFDAIDGFLIPRWHGNDTYSSYPDHTRTKKIKIQEDLKFDKEMAGKNFDVKMMQWGALLCLFGIILISAGLGVWWYAYGQLTEMPNNAVTASNVCLDTAQGLVDNYGSVIERNIDFYDRLLQRNLTVVENDGQNNGIIEKTINDLSKS